MNGDYSPVSNSGRLVAPMRDLAETNLWPWQIVLVPDPVIIASQQLVCTADRVIFDVCRRWFDLAGEVFSRHVLAAWVVDLA